MIVQAGDVIGVYVVSDWQGALSTSGGPIVSGLISKPAVGDTVALGSPQFGTNDESATLVTAGEAAATLVSDATGLAPGSALAHQATAIQAAVNRGDTATTCTGITDFLGLVQSQTGKKLSQANATLLTTDANNLSAALGC